MDQLASWWDGAELWVAGLPFIPQVILVLAVMIPCCFGIAWLLDRALSVVFALLGRAEIVDPDGSTGERTKVEGF
ncbi:hypothetical protein ERC79_02865 [Rhodococcus sp. ABRD24]|uniref:hypothetical protein n=1 Tax=Rhodococcus sp. ABRD24 TaxID=2507582 RepID=UPI001039A19D|nr:hypothetical protein [Rhodococcus sp. ABRD24]QBJ95022.1 hypothetical protein ERC79_02865 [Rhodococcus sp. ABRD24]